MERNKREKKMRKTTQALKENQQCYKKVMEILPLKENEILESIADEEMKFIAETFFRRK